MIKKICGLLVLLGLLGAPALWDLPALITFTAGEWQGALSPWILWIGFWLSVGIIHQSLKGLRRLFQAPDPSSYALQALLAHQLGDTPLVEQMQRKLAVRPNPWISLFDDTTPLSPEILKALPPVVASWTLHQRLATATPETAWQLLMLGLRSGLKMPWFLKRLFHEAWAHGDHEQAFRTLKALGHPAEEESLFQERHAQTLLKDPLQAEYCLRRAHKLAPHRASAAIALANLLARQGKKDTAEEILARTWGLAPSLDLALAWFALYPSWGARFEKLPRLCGADLSHPLNVLVSGWTGLQAHLWVPVHAAIEDLRAPHPLWSLFLELSLAQHKGQGLEAPPLQSVIQQMCTADPTLGLLPTT